MPSETKNRIALVFGASGLVGSNLIELLAKDMSYQGIKVFVRKPINFESGRIQQHIIDFSKPEEYHPLIQGDDLFICLGTTIRKAGSVRKVEETDRDLPVSIAESAFQNGVKRVAVVSSLGADSASRNYYLRIKGEMEEGIRKVPFDQIVIVRPSMLLGHRNEFRFGELIGKVFMKAIGFLLVGPARKYRAISGRAVARAMIDLIKSSRNDVIYLSDELQKLGRSSEF